jgi:predicted transcriptional regulator
MGCIDPNDPLSEAGKRLLGALEVPRTAEEVRELTGEPLFRVRYNLREMVKAGLATKDGERYSVSEAGEKMLER